MELALKEESLNDEKDSVSLILEADTQITDVQVADDANSIVIGQNVDHVIGPDDGGSQLAEEMDLSAHTAEDPGDAEMAVEAAGIGDVPAGVDIVTLPSNPMQPMFQIVGSSGDPGSYILSDGQVVQATATANNPGFTTFTLGGISTLIQPGEREAMEGQAVQLEDGSTTTIVQGLVPGIKAEGTMSPKILEGQVIQLEDGTTGLIQAGFTGSGGVQSVQLEDGSTAYISLFGDATHPGTLSIETAAQADDSLGTQALEVSLENPSITAPVPDKINIKVEPSAGPSRSQSLLSVISQTMAKQKPKMEMAAQEPGTLLEKEAASLGQPHVSYRALALGDKAYKCMYDDCGRLYTTHHHLKVHERSHTGDKPFRCEFPSCGKAFPTGYGLKSHTRVHTGEKPYRCTHQGCVKAFKTSGDLQKHVRTHTGERPFVCPFEGCNRSFTTSNIRKVHIRTHTGERPYVCQEDGCGKTFASATNYKNHIRIHTGEKPYVCTVEGCGKRFTEYSSLYKHHVVHTQSKPYVCNHCHKTYRQTSTLAMHKRTVHNDHDISIETDVCNHCHKSYRQPAVHALTIHCDKQNIHSDHNVTVETDNTVNILDSVGSVQILPVAHVDVDPTTVDKDADTAEGEGALVINTSFNPSTSSSVADTSSAGAPRVLSSLQGSPTLLQHLQPGNLGGLDGVQQVFLITDPSQLQALKSLTSPSSVATTQNTTTTIANDNSQSDGVVGQAPVTTTLSDVPHTGMLS